MKLLHLSIASIIGSALGVLLLLALTLNAADQVRSIQADISELFSLRERIDQLSVATDNLVLQGAGAELAGSVRTEADAIRAQLEGLGDTHPDALKAARLVELLITNLFIITNGSSAGSSAGAGSAGDGAEALTIRPAPVSDQSRILLSQIAQHGIALDTALDDVLRERRAALANRAQAAAVRLVIAALLFGLLCIAAFGLIYWRIATPIRRLTQTVARIGAGDGNARAQVSGRDETAVLAKTLNRMLDQQEVSRQRLLQYCQLVEGSEDLMAIADEHYRYLLVNDAYARAFGRERSKVEGAYIWELLGEPYFDAEAKPRLDRCLSGQPERYETRRRGADGRERELLVRYFPITPSSDGRRQVVAVITDISELKQAERQVREQAHLLDIAGRIARFGGWRVDFATNRVEWSAAVTAIHGMPEGYSPSVDEAIAFYAPEDQDRIRCVFTQCREQGIAYDEALRIINADGEPVWVRATGEAVLDADGRISSVQGAFQDISALKSAEHEAEALAERLQKTLESITDGFFTLDRDWRFTYLNQEAARLLQHPREQLLGQDFWQCFPEAIGTRIERAYRQAMLTQETTSFEEYYRPFSTWFEIRAYPSSDGLAVYFQDVSERHRMVRSLQSQKSALRRSRDQLAELVETRRALIDSLPAHIALLDRQGRIIDVNDQWRRFGEENGLHDALSGIGTNYIELCDRATGDRSSEAAPIAQGLRDLLAGDQHTFALEYPCHSPDEQRWFRVTANRLKREDALGATDQGQGAVVMHVDITERKLAELQLSQLINRDRLTDLLTRTGFTKALNEYLDANQDGSPAVLAMFDIKDLRDVNDAYGFEAGDQLLIEVARWLERVAGSNGLVGRIAGDEFSVLLPVAPGADPHEPVQALKRISEHRFLRPEIGIEIAIDLGYTVVTDTAVPAEERLHQAELALFQHRAHGIAPPIAYNAELDQQVHERLELSRDLRTALDERQFELHFQPKVRLVDGQLVSGEALLRWNHPQRGLQPPGLFIPIAEQSQQIGPIGEWALHEACRRLSEWQQAGLEVVGIAVNVSLIQFRLTDFPGAVRTAIETYRIDPGALTLEITESVFEGASTSLLQELNALRALGVRLSLDDFGTGYSSLAYLQRYPFDEIKVDRFFVASALDDHYSRRVLQTVKGVGDALGADLIAEGIESEPVRQALLDMGYELGQGYLFSMPLETEDFRWLLEQGCQLPLGAGATAARADSRTESHRTAERDA
ncbi:EAL domain-containing protein [Halochromatium glycolicum]|uniref:PAS domain S-box-containing protein/diguanylate cyclase (GGDEF) domain-containing protein n=1 Tax=Halochromatium glycolicum TaxID=85075 RepID=A0AAJ0U267_9GAMM|nr:EAL domain-containing protein [Halochromatium glycolicum]MBK1703693.1 hypothetical protein [Halochromatium glycolicum]